MGVDIGVNVDRDVGRDVGVDGVDQTAVLPSVFFDRLLHIEIVTQIAKAKRSLTG